MLCVPTAKCSNATRIPKAPISNASNAQMLNCQMLNCSSAQLPNAQMLNCTNASNAHVLKCQMHKSQLPTAKYLCQHFGHRQMRNALVRGKNVGNCHSLLWSGRATAFVTLFCTTIVSTLCFAVTDSNATCYWLCW